MKICSGTRIFILTWIVLQCICIFCALHIENNTYTYSESRNNQFQTLAYSVQWPFERDAHDIEKVESIVITQNTHSERPSIYYSAAWNNKNLKYEYKNHKVLSAAVTCRSHSDSVFLCKIQV